MIRCDLSYGLITGCLVMNPEGESSIPKGRGRGFCRQAEDYKELRRPLAEKRIGMDTIKLKT